MQEAVFKAIICVNALFLRDATNCCVTFSVLLCYGYNRNNMELEIWRNQFKVMGKQGANHECNRQKYKKIEKRTEAVSKTAGGAAPCDAAGGIQLGNRSFPKLKIPHQSHADFCSTDTAGGLDNKKRRYAPRGGVAYRLFLWRFPKGATPPFGTRLCEAKCSVLYALSALP